MARVKSPNPVPKVKARDLKDARDLVAFHHIDESPHTDPKVREAFDRDWGAAVKKGVYKRVPTAEAARTFQFYDNGRKVAPEHKNNTIVVAKVPGGHHVVIDGNHRMIHAMREGRPHLNVLHLDLPWAHDLDAMETSDPDDYLKKTATIGHAGVPEPGAITGASALAGESVDPKIAALHARIKKVKKGLEGKLKKSEAQTDHWAFGEWLEHEDPDARDELPELKGEKWKNAKAELASVTQTRKNAEGKTEFLLHRGHHVDDPEMSDPQRRTSWTPHRHVAEGFAPEGDQGRVTSAWIPSNRIVTIPKHHIQGSDHHRNRLEAEHEVVVFPHPYETTGSGIKKSLTTLFKDDAFGDAKSKMIDKDGPYSVHDYSSILSPKHREAGYALILVQSKKGRQARSYNARVELNGEHCGDVEASHPLNWATKKYDQSRVRIEGAGLTPEHRGKGLGQAMYEAIYHAAAKNGARYSEGDVHTEMAHAVHERLAAKHGFKITGGGKGGPRSGTRKPYAYELPLANTKKSLATLHGVTDLVKDAFGDAPTGLTARHKQAGYTMKTGKKTTSTGHVEHYATIHHKGRIVGRVNGLQSEDYLSIEGSHLSKKHRGQGLGQAMYEGMYEHAIRHGVKEVGGIPNTEDAYQVHRALARKHGIYIRYFAGDPEDEEMGLKPEYSYPIKKSLADLHEKVKSATLAKALSECDELAACEELVKATPKEDIFEHAKKLQAQMAKVAAEMPRTILFQNRLHPDLHHLISGDPGKPGRWRVTHYTKGEPTGHTEAQDYPSAIRTAHEYGADLSREVDESEMTKSELEKGQNGDWKKEGYEIREGKSGLGHDFAIEAHHPEHGMVGRAAFKANSTGTKLIPVHVRVADAHQRKGIATAMYSHAERVWETPIANRASHQTRHAQALWSQPKRPFGKK